MVDEQPGPQEPIFEALIDEYLNLKVFPAEWIRSLAFTSKRGKPYVRCLVTDKDRPATREEIVRQLFLKKLMKTRDAKEGLRAFLEKRPPKWRHQ